MIGSRTLARLSPMVVLLALWLLLPSSAFAAESLIDFEDLPVNTAVTNQYESRGVVFGTKPDGSLSGRPRVISALGRAHSGVQVGSITDGTAEFPASNVWGRLLSPTSFVEIYVGHGSPDPPGTPHTFVLEAFDTSGNSLGSNASSIARDFPVTQRLYFAAPSAATPIAFFNVHDLPQRTNSGAIDDLRFSVPGPGEAAPDFGIARVGDNVPVLLDSGTSVRVPLTVRRFSGSSGPIVISVEGLPTGVTPSVDPPVTEGGDGSAVTLTLTAAANVASVNTRITVRGTPGSAAVGPGPRALSIPLKVIRVPKFDLRANGIDVFQGTQDTGQPDSGRRESDRRRIPRRSPRARRQDGRALLRRCLRLGAQG
jgi:hypothetical protein